MYRIILGRIRRRPTNFSWLIKGKVAGSGCPMSKRELEWMTKEKVGSILSLTEERLPEEWVSTLGLTYLHLPLVDHTPPQIEVIDRAMKYVQEQVSKGRAVAVHCNAGQGRTGTILAAYLLYSQNLKPNEAINFVRRVRPSSIERRQEESIQKYFEALHG